MPRELDVLIVEHNVGHQTKVQAPASPVFTILTEKQQSVPSDRTALIRARRKLELKLIHARNRRNGFLLRRSMRSGLHNLIVERRCEDVWTRQADLRAQLAVEISLKQELAKQRRNSILEASSAKRQHHFEIVAERKQVALSKRRQTSSLASLLGLFRKSKKSANMGKSTSNLTIAQQKRFYIPLYYESKAQLTHRRGVKLQKLSQRRKFRY
ncbi:hypothetical protein RCL1_007067 [Eukaryota sp. TZLM3-RCL]